MPGTGLSQLRPIQQTSAVGGRGGDAANSPAGKTTELPQATVGIATERTIVPRPPKINKCKKAAPFLRSAALLPARTYFTATVQVVYTPCMIHPNLTHAFNAPSTIITFVNDPASDR